MTGVRSTSASADPVADSEIGFATPPGARPDPAGRIGQVLGSYRLLEVIGGGGMGCVYRAEHVRLGRAVAVKVLHDHHARRRDALRRFLQEARAASQIRHPNIVDVLDYLEGDPVSIVMEYLPGPSLDRLLDAAGGGLPAVRALDLAAQIAEGLAVAHAAGIVHRDLKPDNVILVGDQVKLLDFGVAKLLAAADDPPLTAAGQVIGTPAYMSPEQASGLPVDARTDIYALGAILHELVTGHTPFLAGSFDEYVFKHLSATPAPPSSTPGGRGIDPRIDALVMRCLEKDPAARIGCARSLRDELLAVRATLVAPRRRLLRRAALATVAATAAALVAVAIAHGGARTQAAPRTRPAASVAAGPPMVRIVSDPPAGIYPSGRLEPLCRTPCAIAVPPRSARPVFMVRRRGYRDESIAVDPDAPPSQVRIRLERAGRGHP
jgi:eukaryotic-like serine/threonine-protein kinase